jgi:hypothetical protein
MSSRMTDDDESLIWTLFSLLYPHLDCDQKHIKFLNKEGGCVDDMTEEDQKTWEPFVSKIFLEEDLFLCLWKI